MRMWWKELPILSHFNSLDVTAKVQFCNRVHLTVIPQDYLVGVEFGRFSWALDKAVFGPQTSTHKSENVAPA